MKAIGFFAISILLVETCSATSISEISLDELYQASEIAVKGRVMSGEIIKNECGVKYKVRVARRFKGGRSSGEQLWVQSDAPLEIGGEYYVFASSTAKEVRPLASANSHDMNLRANYLRRCQRSRPMFVVNAFGDGALKSAGTYDKDMPRAVFLNTLAILPPSHMRSVSMPPSKRYDHSFFDAAIDAEDFAAYMKNLADTDGASRNNQGEE